MIAVLLQFIPLALAAIAPAMIVAVILMLSAKGGLAKSLAFVLGRVLIYTLWGLLFLALAVMLSDTGSGEASTASLAIKTILGGLLLILAVKIYMGEDDPDAPPPKWMTALEKASSGAMFAIGALLSIVQIRFVLLMLAGATIIVDANLPAVQTIIALIVLVLAVIWLQLLPIVLYVVMGERAQAMLDSLNDWLARNQRVVNVVVLGLFGILLLAQGLPGLLS
jgi:threonine/homoserine/homoserine lactone efflux protein